MILYFHPFKQFSCIGYGCKAYQDIDKMFEVSYNIISFLEFEFCENNYVIWYNFIILVIPFNLYNDYFLYVLTLKMIF